MTLYGKTSSSWACTMHIRTYVIRSHFGTEIRRVPISDCPRIAAGRRRRATDGEERRREVVGFRINHVTQRYERQTSIQDGPNRADDDVVSEELERLLGQLADGDDGCGGDDDEDVEELARLFSQMTIGDPQVVREEGEWQPPARRIDTNTIRRYNDLLAKDGAVSQYLHASMTVAASVPVLAAGGFPKLSRNLFG